MDVHEQPVVRADEPEPEREYKDEKHDEKNEPSIDVKSETSEGDPPITDLFTSFPPLKGVEPEKNPLTVRAVIVGILLGSLVNASNVYLGRSFYLFFFTCSV